MSKTLYTTIVISNSKKQKLKTIETTETALKYMSV